MEIKICSHCKLEKSLADYYFDKSKGKARHACKMCEALHCKKYREKNREKIAVRKKRYRQENPFKSKIDYEKRKFQEISLKKKYKESNPCTDCGKFYPYYVMDYDHVDHRTKLGNPFSLPDNLMESEIRKCELVCANCHRIRTHNYGTQNYKK